MSNSQAGNSLEKLPSKAHASWTDNDNTRLIEFLYERRAAGSDGSFKKDVFVAAAKDLAPLRAQGGVKSWDTCKRQWAKLKAWHKIVSAYRDSSGSIWDPNHSGSLYSTPAEEQVFSAYCLKLGQDGKILRKLIGGRGWTLFEKIDAIRPVGSTATGQDAHYSSQPTQTAPDKLFDIDDKDSLDDDLSNNSAHMAIDEHTVTPQLRLEPQSSAAHSEQPLAFSESLQILPSLESNKSSATRSSYSSKGKRKHSAIPDDEFKHERSSKQSKRSSRSVSGNKLDEPGAAALLNGINGTFTDLSQTVRFSTQSTPQGYVKDAIEKLNGAWGINDGFSAVEKSVLLQLFSNDFKKATTYATNVDPEARRLWADLELLELQDKIVAAEKLLAKRRTQMQSSGAQPGPSGI